MPWLIRDVVNDINKAVAQRWQSLDPLLPEPSDLPEGCMPPLLAVGDNSRPSGLGVCRHQHVAADTLAQTWGAATKFVLSMRLRGPDIQAAADDLLTQWRDHLTSQPEARKDDIAAIVNWPARDVTGVLALLRHGLQPITVIAVRPAGAQALQAAQAPQTAQAPRAARTPRRVRSPAWSSARPVPMTWTRWPSWR